MKKDIRSENLESVEPETNLVEPEKPAIRRPRGPRTGKGKEKSKYNALKHRIFAKVAVLKDEPKGVFNALLTGLREHYKPVGTLEELLVEKTAVDFWRLHRCYAAEGRNRGR
jgi:hypothetical protein